VKNTYGAGLFLAPFVVRINFRLCIHQLLVSVCLIHSIHLFLDSFVAAYDFCQLKLLSFLRSYVFRSWLFFFSYVIFENKTFVTDYD